MVNLSAFEFNKLKNKVSDILSVNLEYKFEIYESNEICVSLSEDKVKIGGKEKTDFSRALMLLAFEIKKGNNEFEIKEKRHFDTLGFSVDLSRNGVVKVDFMKKIIDFMALMGFNVLKLYMEDVFDLPGYPHFGYRRGKYSESELKEIDDYAYSSGIEVIPSVQTLGHLSQYLRYCEASGFSENTDVLLCGEEKTYEFIEAIVKRMRECFRTKRLVINCDEARGVGVKKIMKEKKYTSPYDISIKHLERTIEICNKYGFRPCVHGDLFYGYLGNGYYDFSFNPDKKEIEKIPDCDVIYWDYYHKEYEDYDTLLKGHRALGNNTLFMGGIWIWAGQLPNAEFTFDTMLPAMECCVDNNVKDVWAATFGDDGNETNIAFAFPQLAIFSEYCFKGKACTKEWIEEISKFVFGIDMRALYAMSSYHSPFVDKYEKLDFIFPDYMGKKLLYTDILYNMTGRYDFSEILPKHKNALDTLKNSQYDEKWEPYFNYAKLIFEITIEKMQLIPMVKEAYTNKDKDVLKEIHLKIPGLISKYEKLLLLHEKQWKGTYKAFGWEELNVRYSGTIGRLYYLERVLEDYLNGKLSIIEELEYDFIEETKDVYTLGKNVAIYSNLKATGI